MAGKAEKQEPAHCTEVLRTQEGEWQERDSVLHREDLPVVVCAPARAEDPVKGQLGIFQKPERGSCGWVGLERGQERLW